ncbi:MAG: hypothetical protein KAW01_01615 [Deltaproteobacteria bacterium]|nr:hypothetical protein [Deltaproteobacteria bacterium]
MNWAIPEDNKEQPSRKSGAAVYVFKDFRQDLLPLMLIHMHILLGKGN